MKLLANKPRLLAALSSAFLCLSLGTSDLRAQVTVQVDSTKPWAGYMNVYDLLGGGQGGYLWGSAWGLADLRGFFTGTTSLTLTPNTNLFNPADPYWANPDGTGAKWLEANFYVDVGSAYQGQTVTFTGDTLSYTLASPWTTVAVIKEFASGYAFVGMTTVPLEQGKPFSVSRPIAAGNIAQYGFMTTGPNCSPAGLAAAGMVVIAVNNSDPSITQEPVPARVLTGTTASFTVVATGSSAVSYQWKRYGTNLLNGGNISGANSATLVIANAQAVDSTTYQVSVSNLAGTIESVPVRLRVVNATDFANALDNPGFEMEVVIADQVPAPWINFSGSALVSTNSFYAFDPNYPVKTKDGTNAVQIFNAGEWNGIYQDAPAAPGDVFTADGWFYMSSQDQLFGTTTANIEVQFRAGGTVLAMWTSSVVDISSPVDTWMHLQATNGVESGYSQITTTNSHYLVAPAGTDRVRYQVTLHNIAAGSGNVYVDAMRLMKKIPAELEIIASADQLSLSWLSQGATAYQVFHKENLADANWTPLGDPILWDGTVKSVPLTKQGVQRFFMVQTL
jgi:hypothetical protein